MSPTATTQLSATDELARDHLSSALRGDAPTLPSPEHPDLIASLRKLSRLHGIEALLNAAPTGTPDGTTWPETLRTQWADAARIQAVKELLQRPILNTLLTALASANVPALLLKGTALAYTHYEAPYLRTRSDTDILVPEKKRHAAHAVLVALGYDAGLLRAYRHASYQRTYTKREPCSPALVIDLHWQLSNRQLFARTFTFDELWAQAIPVPSIGTAAKALCNTHALLHACLHRVAHFRGPIYLDGAAYLEPNRLIWLYDMRLMCCNNTDATWQAFVELACRKNHRLACTDGLSAARRFVGAVVPSDIFYQLKVSAADDPSATYLRPRGMIRQQLDELNAMPRLANKLLLILDLTFPPPQHMFDKYRTTKHWTLPWLYVRRALSAIIRAARFS